MEQPKVTSIKYGENPMDCSVSYLAKTDKGFRIVNGGYGGETYAINDNDDVNGREFEAYMKRVSGVLDGLEREHYLEKLIDVYEGVTETDRDELLAQLEA